MPEIRHLSLSARAPETCARQLAELSGGEALPFGARYLTGGWICLWQAERNHLVEFIPWPYRLQPGPDGAVFVPSENIPSAAQHLQLALDCSPEELTRRALSAGIPLQFREGFGGPLYEAWLEPELLIELLIPPAELQAPARAPRLNPPLNPPAGGPLHVRIAVPADAAGLLEHLQRVLSQPPVMIPKRADEIDWDKERMARRLTASPGNLVLLAETETGIVASLDLKSPRRKDLAHTARLGMAIQPAWRGQGLGSRMLATALAWARAGNVLRRIELQVYADNAAALALYRKFCFVCEGRRRGAVCFEGRFLDELLLGLWLEDGP